MADIKNRFDWPPIGQDKVVAFLEKSLVSGKLAQTYIFAGPKDLGKSSLALAFARNLWQSDRGAAGSGNFESLNSDLYILEKDDDKQVIGVEATRNFIKRLGLSSFMNSYKIGIIKEAETLSSESQSALLKTLEEPRAQVVIILLTEKL
ncbi:MAG TPA: DNA polymerase III subunit delta', partial [bacterium]|nr:DNA polymerase III subunit delta' [bacterium]